MSRFSSGSWNRNVSARVWASAWFSPQHNFYSCWNTNTPYFWKLFKPLGVSLGSHSTDFSLGDATEGLVPDLQSLIFLPFTDKLCCLPRYSATSGSQLWGLPSSLPCCFLSCHKPAASPCALFSGEIPGEDGLLFWSVLLISCAQLLSSLHTSPTV